MTLAIPASKAADELTEERCRHSVHNRQALVFKGQERLKCQLDNKGNAVALLSESVIVNLVLVS